MEIISSINEVDMIILDGASGRRGWALDVFARLETKTVLQSAPSPEGGIKPGETVLNGPVSPEKVVNRIGNLGRQ